MAPRGRQSHDTTHGTADAGPVASEQPTNQDRNVARVQIVGSVAAAVWTVWWFVLSFLIVRVARSGLLPYLHFLISNPGGTIDTVGPEADAALLQHVPGKHKVSTMKTAPRGQGGEKNMAIPLGFQYHRTTRGQEKLVRVAGISGSAHRISTRQAAGDQLN